jgi:hypothetical protein
LAKSFDFHNAQVLTYWTSALPPLHAMRRIH